jgi:hypothetical protein
MGKKNPVTRTLEVVAQPPRQNYGSPYLIPHLTPDMAEQQMVRFVAAARKSDDLRWISGFCR